MNLLLIPFHDWRKIKLEGFRTRDAHFIEELSKYNEITKVIINRPTTIVEILLKRKRKLIDSKVVYSESQFKLYQINDNEYLIDFVSQNIVGQLFKGYKWFIKQYSNPKYISFINTALKKIGINEDYNLLSQNVFAYKLEKQLNSKVSIFDAWDNFLKFKVYANLNDTINNAYYEYAKNCHFWITNSKDNFETLGYVYKPKDMLLIKNGVDTSRFSQDGLANMPADMKKIKPPIIGFGGKITQLLDTSLINNTIEFSRELSFVFVGQILDKEVYNKIKDHPNLYYLGDKHYDEYPNYVRNFDICIVPYVINENEKSGANTIKVYEYLATHKKVVGTNSNGLEDLNDYVYIANDWKEFSKEIKSMTNEKKKIDVSAHSWDNKVKQLIDIIEEYEN